MKFNILICFAFIQVMPYKVCAQFFYKHYSTEQGLPSSEVYDIHQDKKGYLWFGTDRGLCRFDGYTFKTFTTQDGLTDNVIFIMVEDNRERIWMTSLVGGLCYYDCRRGIIKPHPANEQIRKRFAGNWLNSFYIDEHDNTWITVSGGSKGIYKVDSLLSIRHIDSLDNVFIDDKHYNVFLKNMNGKDLVYGKIAGAGSAGNTQRITKTKAGNMLLGFQKECSQSLRLHCIQLNNGNYLCAVEERLIAFNDSAFIVMRDCPSAILSLYQDKSGNIWLGSMAGVYLYRKGNLHLKPEVFFTDKTISGIFQDTEGSYWISTLQDGVFYIPSIDIKNLDAANGLKENRVMALTKGDGAIWAGTYSGYLYKISEEQGLQEIRYSKTPGHLSDLIYTPDGTIWMTNRYRVRNGKTSFFDPLFGYLKSYSLSDKNDLLIGSGMGFGIISADGKTFNSNSIGFLKGVTAMHQDSKGVVWLGTHEGLCRFYTGKVTYPDSSNTLYRHRISDIKEDACGTLVIGTMGAGILLKKESSVTSIGKEQGLLSDLVEKVLPESDNIWVASYKGLNRIKRKGEKMQGIETFTVANGLPSNEVNDLLWDKGTLYIATNKGLAIFQPGGNKQVKPAPPVYITSVRINDQDTIVQNHYDLKYNQGNVGINFIGISYSSAGRIIYRYKLDSDSNWKYTRDLGVQYTNLPSGSHTFFLSAMNESGVWNPAPALIHFRIGIHFTKTWWFLTLLFIGSVALVILFVYLYIRNHKRKSNLERNIIKSEQKALLSQMNPHFIFNAMNSILYLIEHKKNASVLYLTKFSSLLRKIMENSKHNLISLEEELSGIQLYLELEKLRFGDNFKYSIHTDENIHLYEMHLPSMLVQPFLENAILHGLQPRNGEGVLKVSFLLLEENKLQCLIEDNGIGRVKAAEISAKRKQHHSNGISNVRERLFLLNQLYKAEMELRITDILNEYEEICGTRVELILMTPD